jgi:hypothetical protein
MPNQHFVKGGMVGTLVGVFLVAPITMFEAGFLLTLQNTRSGGTVPAIIVLCGLTYGGWLLLVLRHLSRTANTDSTANKANFEHGLVGVDPVGLDNRDTCVRGVGYRWIVLPVALVKLGDDEKMADREDQIGQWGTKLFCWISFAVLALVFLIEPFDDAKWMQAKLEHHPRSAFQNVSVDLIFLDFIPLIVSVFLTVYRHRAFFARFTVNNAKRFDLYAIGWAIGFLLALTVLTYHFICLRLLTHTSPYHWT